MEVRDFWGDFRGAAGIWECGATTTRASATSTAGSLATFVCATSASASLGDGATAASGGQYERPCCLLDGFLPVALPWHEPGGVGLGGHGGGA